jgi:hypothetical protein
MHAHMPNLYWTMEAGMQIDFITKEKAQNMQGRKKIVIAIIILRLLYKPIAVIVL